MTRAVLVSDRTNSSLPPRRSLRADLALAILPTVSVLLVFALASALSRQRLLFAPLAASAFLIYLDPEHEANSVRTLVLAQGFAALTGFAAHILLGPSYWVAGAAMVVVIFGMILARAMHPPAVPTVLSFVFGAESGRGLLLFGVCVGLLVVLVFLQIAAVRLLSLKRRKDAEF